MTSQTRPAKISFRTFALLQSGAFSRVHHGRASLTCVSGYFIMRGPSGTHTLLASETDVKRLNAHWQGFASDARNQYA